MFSVIRQTDTHTHTHRHTHMNGQTEIFLLQILTPRGPKRRGKKIRLDPKKVPIDPIAIYAVAEPPDI